MKAQDPCCREFRDALSRSLEGRPQPARLAQLSWHEHLLGCDPCRDLLEREEALEMLLATLPDPQLPPDLTRRVILRLESGRVELDALLDLDQSLVPVGLAARVEAGVRAELALDALLDQDRVELPEGLAARIEANVRGEVALDALLDLDVVELPQDLAERVLAGLEREAKPTPRLRILRSVLVYAAAAGLLWVALTVRPEPEEEPREHEVAYLDAMGNPEPDPELLAQLDMLELDELWGEPQDLELLLSENVDEGEELLLDYLDYLEDEDEPSDG